MRPRMPATLRRHFVSELWRVCESQLEANSDCCNLKAVGCVSEGSALDNLVTTQCALFLPNLLQECIQHAEGDY